MKEYLTKKFKSSSDISLNQNELLILGRTPKLFDTINTKLEKLINMHFIMYITLESVSHSKTQIILNLKQIKIILNVKFKVI